MKKTKQEVEDIYRASDEESERPSTAESRRKEMERDVARYNMRSIILGVLFALLTVGIVFLVARFEQPRPMAPGTDSSLGQTYISKHSLSPEESWVMSYAQVANQSLSENLESIPFSTQWIKNAAYHVIMGQQAVRQGMDRAAIFHFNRALLLYPSMIGVHGELGTAYLREGVIPLAVTHLQEGIEEEDSPELVSNLGVALMQAEDASVAETYLLTALERLPNNPGCHKNLILFYQKADLPEKVIHYFKSYLELQPDDADSVEQFVVYLQEQGQRKEAISFLETHCKQYTETATPLYLLLAKMKAQALDVEGAVEALNNMRSLLSPNLLLVETNDPDFDPIREKEAFSALVKDLELAAVVLQETTL